MAEEDVIELQMKVGERVEGIRNMYADVSNWKEVTPDNLSRRYFPDKPETKVPLAIVLAVITKSAEETALLAANVGGDSDSVASIGGAIAGALNPASVNPDWVKVVNAVNGDDLSQIAGDLSALRQRTGIF